MFHHIAETRRTKIDPDNPEDLKNSIHAALDEMRGYSLLQTRWVQSQKPVFDLVDEIAQAALRLRELGHNIPTLNLVGINPEFTACFAMNDVTAPISEKLEQMQTQAELKETLLKKWGPGVQRETLKLPPVPVE